MNSQNLVNSGYLQRIQSQADSPVFSTVVEQERVGAEVCRIGQRCCEELPEVKG